MGCLGLSFLGGDMTHDEFRSWALKQLEEHMRRSMPVAKFRMAGNREYRKKLSQGRRVIAAKHAARVRSIRKCQIESEVVLRKRAAELDAEVGKCRWNLIMGCKNS